MIYTRYLSCFLVLVAFSEGGEKLNQIISTNRKWKQSDRRLTEDERVAQWYQRGNSWPPTWQPYSQQFLKLMQKRENDIQQLKGGDERFENWVLFTQGFMVPRFTERGFEVIQTPPEIQEKLKQELAKGLKVWDSLPEEEEIDVLDTPIASKFYDMSQIGWEVLQELQPLHEKWAGGMELIPTSAYGTRLYQRGATLSMHYDKIETHVISSIVHIAHEYDDDNEPWTIEIEDHNGNEISVVLVSCIFVTCCTVLPSYRVHA